MRQTIVAAATALAVAGATPALGQAPPPATEVGAAQLALTNLPAKGGAKLTVTTPAFQTGGDIPFENTQYKGNIFPGLAWTPGPAGTKVYAIIMQDTDAMVRGAPILHWTMVNVPSTVTKLATLTAAMKDHVLASGEVIGLGQVMPTPPGDHR